MIGQLFFYFSLIGVLGIFRFAYIIACSTSCFQIETTILFHAQERKGNGAKLGVIFYDCPKATVFF